MTLKNFSVRTYSIAGIFAGACVFLLTLTIAPYYILGDQWSYIYSYNYLVDLNWVEGFAFYTATLSSTEIVHYLLTKLASGYGIEKNFLMAVSNALLAYLTMRLFEKLKASVFIAMAIVFTNFYMFVMYFAAERLKFGFIFLTLSILHLGQGKRFYVLSALAVFSHVQVLLVYGSIYFTQLVKKFTRFYQTLKLSYKGFVVPLIALMPLAFLAEHIYSKFDFYFAAAAEKDLFDLIRLFLLFALTMWYSKNKNETFLLFMPLVLAAFLIGSDRVNMMAYFVFLYYGLQHNGGLNFGVSATSIYFALKSYGFVVNIIQHGDGFQNF